ncbi:stilbene synthase [Verrucomicrobiaceae bacterium R5-34]|uniref:Stilbene synthase n=1 Tax=Oceaniferula flava TaxID=2800421 RepID=A0AAE2SFN7_9BACT|nr:3-oxoacyl-[acyl-carrier-protein] synthase III C-terminal domain-containing protein [Oceaniferula flavus]MBK1830868.1 stilbene synthase [Verrucomicrobiaceae bacterium R5-34]MBK1855715.1 stilbene synthase [Oceaniferula flavus]MBM1137022.1 stilbene synthase [Oceaniferula flavus]
MNLLGIASAFPTASFTQPQCLAAMQEADFWLDLDRRSQVLLGKVLGGDSGINKRHFALDQLTDAWRRDAQALNEAYERQAPKLAAEAVKKALAKSGHRPEEIDALLVCSCTGYLCPGVSSYTGEQLGLREDAVLQDMTGLGCGAAVPMLRVANSMVAERPDAVVVTVAVEICSAAFYVEDDFGVLISTCLFGDGAAAAVWSGAGGTWQVGDFESLHRPQHREKIRFTNAGGKLRNQLDKSVPLHAAETVEKLYAKRRGEPQAWVTHGGGRDVIEQLETVLPCDELSLARAVMRDYGNLSSPSVLVALERFLEQSDGSEDRLWMCAFGAGFSAHSCEIVRS